MVNQLRPGEMTENRARMFSTATIHMYIYTHTRTHANCSGSAQSAAVQQCTSSRSNRSHGDGKDSAQIERLKPKRRETPTTVTAT